MIYLNGVRFRTVIEAEHWIGARDDLYASRVLAGASEIQLRLTERRHPELYMDGWAQKKEGVREVLMEIQRLQQRKEPTDHLETRIPLRSNDTPVIFEDDEEFIQLARKKSYWISASKKINPGFDELKEGGVFRFSHEKENRKVTRKLSIIKVKEMKQKPIHELLLNHFSPEKVKIMMNNGRVGSYSKVIWFE